MLVSPPPCFAQLCLICLNINALCCAVSASKYKVGKNIIIFAPVCQSESGVRLSLLVVDHQQPECPGHLGGEVDDVLAQLEGGGAGDVLPGGLLGRPRDRAEQSDVGRACLSRQAGQRD